MNLEVRSPFKFNQRVYRKVGQLVDVPTGMEGAAARLLHSGAAIVVFPELLQSSTDTPKSELKAKAGAENSSSAPAQSEPASTSASAQLQLPRVGKPQPSRPRIPHTS